MSSHEHNDEESWRTPGERFTNFLNRKNPHYEHDQKDVGIAFALGIFYTLVFVALGAWAYPKWMPTVMSTDMKGIERLMVVFTYISAPVCGVVLGVATYTFMNRHRGDTPPPDGPMIRTHRLTVGLWTGISTVLAVLAILYGLIELNSANDAAVADSKNALVVNVTGSQWVWSFNYPAQGITTHELMLPINQPVQFNVVSTDVNHNFWPVQLGVKTDANRLAVTHLDTTPTKLGKIDVKCAELCGLYHAYMETNGEIMTSADFNNWVTAQGGHRA